MYRLMQRIEVKTEERVIAMGEAADKQELFTAIAQRAMCALECGETFAFADCGRMLTVFDLGVQTKRVYWIEEILE